MMTSSVSDDVCDDVCVCVCQYAADAKDKQWLAERHHMRATGGKMVRMTQLFKSAASSVT